MRHPSACVSFFLTTNTLDACMGTDGISDSVLALLLHFQDNILGLGLDSSNTGHPHVDTLSGQMLV